MRGRRAQGRARSGRATLTSFLALIGALVSLLAVPVAASAAGTLDQHEEGATFNSGFNADSSAHAQTFTAGITGVLDHVEVLLSRTACDPGNLTVQIRTTTPGGDPTSTVLASATVPSSSVTTSFPPDWESVAFATPPPSVSGTRYAIVLTAPDGSIPVDPGDPFCYYSWFATEGNPYAGGQGYVSFDGGSTFSAEPSSDYNLRTFVAPPDTTPPDTSITSGPSGTVRSTSASFGFSSSESGSSFECRRNGGAWAACTSPKAYSSLSQGSHTFEVAATDGAGNRDMTPAKRTWRVDTVKPVVKAVSPSSGATGVSPTVNVLATFSESMRSGTITRSTVKLVRKGTTTPVTATVTYDPALKRAKLDPSSSLRRGATYAATVTTGVKDLAGNPMAANKTWSFRVRP